MILSRCTLELALVAGLLVACGNLRAADDPAEKKSAPPKVPQPAEANDESQPAPKEDAKDPYALPEGGVKELLAFIKETMAIRPKTREELAEYRSKGIAALQAAAEKILKIATPEDRQLEGFDDAEALLLALRAGKLMAASPDERKQFIADVKTYFQNHENPSKFAVQAAMQCASGVEYGGGSPEQAAEVYRELGAVLSRSKDPLTAKTGEKMEGAARRLSLLGNTMEISGTEMDGKAFDWAKLRGKVVLVDFWATWCGPCIGELPNVRKNYELYHDKGFEIVGISLDNNRKALEAFLEKEQTPWITLHDGPWNDNAVATHYGVMGIPTVILVDQEGKVVSTRARGPELGRQLEKLLGPAEPAEKDPAAEDKSEGDKPAGADK